MARRNGSPVFQLIPDLAFRKGNQFPLLLDTKYKVLDADSRKLGISPDDFYRMFAYAHCYDCPRVVMIYPQTAGITESVRARFVLEGSVQVIEAATVD